MARIVQQDHAEPLAYDVTMADDGDHLVRTPRDRSADLLPLVALRPAAVTEESDRPFGSAQRRVEHEALAQSLARAGGARVHEVRSGGGLAPGLGRAAGRGRGGHLGRPPDP